MADLGRNDPCHCGSGKKYKKCCLKKDREAEQLEREKQRTTSPPAVPAIATSQTTPTTPKPEVEPEPPDPHIEAINALWKELQASDYEGKIAIFYDTLANKPHLMDDEMAFEFFDDIYYEAAKRNDQERFEALTRALREQLPDVYAAEARFILGYRIENALVAGRYDDIPPMVKEMATNAEANIDQFFGVMDQLAYHNQLAALIPATRLAWPQVKNSSKVFGGEDLASQAVDYIVFDYVSRTAAPDGQDPALLEQVSFYMSIDQEKFADFVATISGQKSRTWTLDDFQLEPTGRRKSKKRNGEKNNDKAVNDGRQNLARLTWEFLSYLYHQKQVPYAKGELARTELVTYILRRYDGDLDEEDEPLFGVFGKSRRKQKQLNPNPQQRHLLCPDHGTMDRHLGGLLNLFSGQYYKAAALFELVPAWLRFLESHQLISGEQREQTLADLSGLDTNMSKIFENNPDPALREAMANWPDDAE